MISYAAALLMVAGFVFLLSRFDLVGKSSRVFRINKEVFRIIKDANMDDLVKEKKMQSYAKILFALFFQILLICCAAIAIPLGLLALMDSIGVLSTQVVLKILLSWQFIIISSICTAALVWFFRRK